MSRKSRSLALGVALTAMLSLCGPASAIVNQPTFTYDLFLSDGLGDFINLDLTTHQLAGPLPTGGVPVVGITGNADINGIEYLASGPFPGPNGNADNLLYSTSPFVDSLGIGFGLTPLVVILTVSDPPYTYNNVGLTCQGGINPCDVFSPTTTQLTQTPLPATLPLLASGLGAMGLFGWRRKRKNAAALAAA